MDDNAAICTRFYNTTGAIIKTRYSIILIEMLICSNKNDLLSVAISSVLKQVIKFTRGGNFRERIFAFNSDLHNANHDQNENVAQPQVVSEFTCYLIKGFDP